VTCQATQLVHVMEGTTASLQCTYKETAFTSLRWYRQFPGKRLDALIGAHKDGNSTEGRFTAEIQRKQSTSYLYVPDSQPADSAMYICAVDAQCDNYIHRRCVYRLERL
ncbi:hypothetical protein GDO86_001618, partial [Hymenochirus boettgeri]